MTGDTSDISVALATCNGARYLEPQLASIAEQTLRPAEVLVFDDGSATAELAAMRAIVARFPGMRLVAGDNVGITANFSRAIAATTGRYVALADQDDIWTPDHLAVLRGAIGNADLVYGDMLFMDEAGQVSAERFSDRISTIGMTSDDPAMFDALLHNTIVWGAAALFHRELADHGAFPDTQRYHDWWLSVLATLGRGVRYVDRIVVHHRIHPANSSHHDREPRGAGGMFGEARRSHRVRQATRALVWLQALKTLETKHAGGPAPDADRGRRLDRAIAYHRSLLADDRRLWRTGYALRHRRFMLPDGSPHRQIAVALSKLL